MVGGSNGVTNDQNIYSFKILDTLEYLKRIINEKEESTGKTDIPVTGQL
jgi:hypothetical protein